MFKMIFVGIIAFLSAELLLLAINSAFDYSSHPIAGLLTRIAFFALLVVMVILGKRENMVYLFILAYPFMRIGFNGISIFTIFSVILVLLYYREILNYLNHGFDIFRVPMFIMGAAVVISTIFARYPLEALDNAVILFSLFGIYLVLSVFLINEERIRIFLILLSTVALFSIVLVFWQFIFGIDSIRLFFGEYNANVGLFGQIKRFPSFFADAQEAGLFFSTMGIFLMGFTSKYFKRNFALKTIIILLFLLLLFNGTRIAIFSLVIGIIILAILQVKIKRLLIIGAIGILFLLAGKTLVNYFPSQIKARFTQNNIEESLEFRTKLWLGGFPIIKKYPFGTGMGRENTYFAALQSRASDFVFDSIGILGRGRAQFENTYLEVLYSLGIFGFLGLLLILLRFFRIEGMFVKKNVNMACKIPIVYITVAMFAWVVCVFTSPKLSYVQTMLIFVFLLTFRNLYSANQKFNLRNTL